MLYTFFIGRVIVSCAQHDEGLSNRIYLFISFPLHAKNFHLVFFFAIRNIFFLQLIWNEIVFYDKWFYFAFLLPLFRSSANRKCRRIFSKEKTNNCHFIRNFIFFPLFAASDDTIQNESKQFRQYDFLIQIKQTRTDHLKLGTKVATHFLRSDCNSMH